MANEQTNGFVLLPGQVVPIAAPVGQGNPQLDNDVYGTQHANHGIGGFQTAATVADRDAIPPTRRSEGMLCYVENDQSIYQLEPNLTTWSIFSGAGGGATTFVRRFVDEVTVSIFGITKAPVYSVYLDESPALLVEATFVFGSIDNSLYGEPTYDQFQVEASGSAQCLCPPDMEVSWITSLQRLLVNFNAQRTGWLVAHW